MLHSEPRFLSLVQGGTGTGNRMRGGEPCCSQILFLLLKLVPKVIGALGIVAAEQRVPPEPYARFLCRLPGEPLHVPSPTSAFLVLPFK